MSIALRRASGALLIQIACTHGGMAVAADAPRAEAKPAARGYPVRPVRFIIPFPPGGGTDVVGRALGQKLSESFGETFIIDNRPGAAGTLGSNIAATAAPDGHTVLLATASFAISAAFYRKLPYDSVRDFEAISLVASQPLVLVTHPGFQANTLKEFLAVVRTNAGKFNYASSSTGGITHLATELFKSMSGTNLSHVPYKGSNPAMTAVLAGEVPVAFLPLGPAMPQIKAGRLRALAVSSEKRTPLMAALPTIAESGVAGYEAGTWYGMLAPRATPAGIVNQLNRQIAAALDSADMMKHLQSQAFDPMPSTPRRFADYLRSEIKKWGHAIKEAGVTEN
jgi:tripartite-type tricarboxylate transporter receptor subunit TctC